jgi:CRP-like cAMP-binding protein
MGNLVQNLSRYGHLPENAITAIAKKVQYKSSGKGDFLYRAGQTPTSLFILKSGALKTYYHADKKVFNAWFLFEDTFFFAANSLYGKRPTFEHAEFLEEAETEYISGDDLNLLTEEFPKINLLIRKILEEYCVILEQRLFLNERLPAKERYEALLIQYPIPAG